MPLQAPPNRVVRLLKPLATDLAKWRLECGRPADDAHVFPTSTGAAWTEVDYRNWRRRHFKVTADAVGLLGARPYDLRHSFASLLLAEQSNPAEVAAELGHSLLVLFSTYAHVIEDLRGLGRVDAEQEIRSARKSARAGKCCPKVAQRHRGDRKRHIASRGFGLNKGDVPMGGAGPEHPRKSANPSREVCTEVCTART